MKHDEWGNKPRAKTICRHRKLRATGLALSATCAALALSSAAQAQTLDNDYWLSVMAYYPKIDTNVRVAAEAADLSLATDVDFEKDLDLDDNEILPSVTAGARFGRVIVGADYYQLKRSGSVGLARDIVFDGVTYPTSAVVESGFNSKIYRLTVGYAFVQKPDLELGAAIGGHVTRFEASLAGQGRVGGQTAQVEARRRSVLAPLPTLGLFGTWKVAPRLELNARADYLSLKIDDYDGRLLNVQAGANYAIMDNVAIGAVYRFVDYRLGVEKDNWNGRIRYKLRGPALVLQASF